MEDGCCTNAVEADERDRCECRFRRGQSEGRGLPQSGPMAEEQIVASQILLAKLLIGSIGRPSIQRKDIDHAIH